MLGWNDSGESFCLGMERLQESHSVLGWNDSRGVLPGTTPVESFCAGMERLRGVILSWDGTLLESHSLGVIPSPPVESFCRRLERVILSWDRTTPGESFCPGMEQLQRCQSDGTTPGSHSGDETTPGESFCPGKERIQGSQSMPG